MLRFDTCDFIGPAAEFDCWRSMPEATSPRWASMRALVSSLGGQARRMAILGYPNPRAALRVIAGNPSIRSAALVSPVRGFAERADALASRLRLDTTLLILQRDPCMSRLRERFFDIVLSRVPIDDSMPVPIEAVVASHLSEMQRIGNENATLIMHMTIRTGEYDPSLAAARFSRSIAALFVSAGLKRAFLGATVANHRHGTIDVMGWANFHRTP